MSGFKYPLNDYQNPDKLLSLLGSVWSRTYDGRAFIRDRIQGQGDRYYQAFLDLQETANAVSRQTVPIFHIENWYAFRIKESEVNNNRAAVWAFDANGRQFDSGLKFDTAVGPEFTVELPADLVAVPMITNRLTESSVVMIDNIDYRVEVARGALHFRDNPFDNVDIPKQSLFEAGELVDREIVLWLYRSQWDRKIPYMQFGYVLDLPLPSTLAYRQLLNAVFDAITGGTAREQVDTLVSVTTGIPLAVVTGEEVVDIRRDADALLVLTDQTVYKFSLNATVTVTVGDTLTAGQSMIDGLEILDFHRGVLNSDLRAIVLGAGILSPDFTGELVFENKEVPLVVTGGSGNERVSFAIGGYPGDVDYFWDSVHARRLHFGKSLYEIMRAAGDIPATINPAAFLVANVLRNNYLGFRIKTASCGPAALDFNPVDLIRKVMPPRSAVLLFIELAPLGQSVTMDAVDDTAMHTFDAIPALSMDVSAAAVDDSYFTVKNVNYSCY